MPDPILDPHIHLWDQRGTPRKASPLVKLLGWNPRALLWAGSRVFPSDLIGFFAKPDYVITDYLQPEYRLDTGGRTLVGCVHVQAGWEGRGAMAPVGETRWLDGLDMPELKGIVGYADLGLGADIEPVLAAHVEASGRFRGVRHMLANSPDPGVHSFGPIAGLSRSAEFRAGFALLAKYGLRYDAWCYHHQLDAIYELAAAHPEVPVILCHAGTPVGWGGPFSQAGRSEAARAEVDRSWRAGMAKLAELPRVHVKLSGLTMPALGFGFHDRAIPPDGPALAEALGPLIRFVIDTFGPERCVFASNFPVDKVSCTWAALYDAYESIVSDASEDERRALFHDNAVRFYDLA